MNKDTRKLFKVTVGSSLTLNSGHCYVLTGDMRDAISKGREEFSWLNAEDRHVVSVEMLSDRVVQ